MNTGQEDQVRSWYFGRDPNLTMWMLNSLARDGFAMNLEPDIACDDN